jgi:hypothetical protein
MPSWNLSYYDGSLLIVFGVDIFIAKKYGLGKSVFCINWEISGSGTCTTDIFTKYLYRHEGHGYGVPRIRICGTIENASVLFWHGSWMNGTVNWCFEHTSFSSRSTQSSFWRFIICGLFTRQFLCSDFPAERLSGEDSHAGPRQADQSQPVSHPSLHTGPSIRTGEDYHPFCFFVI